METRDALKYATYYHTLALLAAAVGYAIVAAGLWYGLRGATGALSLTEPLAVLAAVDPLPAVAGLFVGLLVKRVGATAAYLKIQTGAVEENVDVPSTSVISRKVGREVSGAVSSAVAEGEAEFEFEDDEGGDGERNGGSRAD